MYMTQPKESLQHMLIILFVCFWTFFVNNHFMPADQMESRNLATAQEMISTGNYLVPTMNGEYRLEKPPLPTWIAAGIESVAPDNLCLQRAATGAAATLMVFFVYLLSIEITGNKRLGLISAIVLATSYNVMMMGRNATWDIYCHCFMLGGIYFFFCAMKRQGAQWLKFIAAGLFWGLSFLSKGPVSFYALLLPFFIGYLLIYRPSVKGKVLPLTVMILTCVVVSAWWTAYIYLFHWDLALFVAHKESSSWLDHNVRPWYYYWKFPVESGIWALFWITSLVWSFKQKRSVQGKDYLFFLIWTLGSLVLLSLMPEKKNRYLLPLLIPGALNIGSYIYHCTKGHLSLIDKRIFKLNNAVIILLLLALPIVIYNLFFTQRYLSVDLFMFISMCSLLLAAIIFRYTFNSVPMKVMPAFYSIAGVMVLVAGLCFIPAGKIFINEDRHSIREIRNVEKLNGFSFYYVQGEELRMEFVYESNRIIRPLNVKNNSVVHSHLPFVMVSSMPADSLFKDKSVAIIPIGLYDNNWRKHQNRRYNPNLVRYVSLIISK